MSSIGIKYAGGTPAFHKKEGIKMKEEKVTTMVKGNIITFGIYEWLVLEVQNDRALLLNKYVICEKPYHEKRTDITWEKCSLRAFLNEEFYSSFNASDKARIIEVTNENVKYRYEIQNKEEDTKDLIFLLSIDDVLKYLSENLQLAKRLSHSKRYINRQQCQANWWTRSIDYDDNYARVMYNLLDMATNYPVDCVIGVRPALWLKL